MDRKCKYRGTSFFTKFHGKNPVCTVPSNGCLVNDYDLAKRVDEVLKIQPPEYNMSYEEVREALRGMKREPDTLFDRLMVRINERAIKVSTVAAPHTYMRAVGTKELERILREELKEMSKHLKILPQYHFDRDEFTKAFYDVFTSDEVFDLIVECQGQRITDEFFLLYDADEFYIIHRESGTMINWYKHLGRTNICNKEGFTLEDLHELLLLLKEDLEYGS